MKKLKALWNSLPHEARVGVYVVGSGAGATLYYYLKSLEVSTETLAGIIAMGIINIVIVFLQTRIPQVREKLASK